MSLAVKRREYLMWASRLMGYGCGGGNGGDNYFFRK